MAKYRQLYTEFWSDSFVLELTSQEKFFYLYILTNTKTKQSGIYELSKRFIEIETGIDRETVDKLIERFCENNKILYCEETKEIMVLNWMKYNVPNNPNAIKCVNKEINKVKNKKFLEILFKQCQSDKLDVEKIFDNIIINNAVSSGSESSRTSVDGCTEEVDKLSSKLIFDTNPEKISKIIENINSDVSNDNVEKKEISKSIEVQAYKHFTRELQRVSKGLPSNRIRSNK